jgi:hypothetical protein
MPPFKVGKLLACDFQLSKHSHLRSFFWGDVWDCRVLEYPAIQEIHNVEVGANHALILAQAKSPRNRHIGLL